MTPEELEKLELALKQLAEQYLAIDNRARALVGYVSDMDAIDSFTTVNLKAAYDTVAEITDYVGKNSANTMKRRKNLNRVAREPII